MSITPYHSQYQEATLKVMALNVPQYFDTSEIDDLRHYLEKETEDYFLIWESSQIIGAGGINYEGSVAIISWDFIHPNFQGKGYGSELLRFRLDKIKKSDRKIDKIRVRTSQLTYLFYQKAGFELIEIKKDFWAKGFDLYAMEIRLGV